ncbi:MAG: transglycosylase SLT domain-containing protein, partial [Chloroflexota bacterium]
MRTHRQRAVTRAAALFAAAVVAAACGGSKDARPSATPPPADATAGGATAPAPTSTSTPAPPDPNLGDRLREAGEFEAAADVYASIAAHTSDDEQQSARLAQAQLLSRAGRYADARAVLDAYLAAAGAAGDASAARYLLASALDDLGETQGALDSYERYITAGGAAADFARIERAKLLARLGRSADAVTAAELVLASNLLPEFKASFTLSMGKAFEQGKDDADALAWYGRAKTIDGGDVASASARIGAIKKRLGDATWSGEYTQAVVSYPSSGVAPDLLDELDAAGIVVSDYARGVVEYRAFRNADARAALARAAASGDNAAEATYYLGALDERAGDNAAAIEDYRRAHELNPASTLADDALWWRGRLLEHAGRFSEAGDVYGALVADYPASSWRGDADFRRGLALYRAQNYAGAALAWSVIAATAGGDDALRARFWQGRALRASRDPLADAVLSQLASDPDARGDFYALRAEVLLGENAQNEKTVELQDASVDWSKTARYLNEVTGTDPQATGTPEADDGRWAAGAALDEVGLRAQSDAVFRSMLHDNRDDAAALFRIARRFAEERRTPLAARAAVTLIGALPKTAPTTPDDLLRVAYPAAFGDLATEAAKQEDISPLLLLSLVRQESFFDAEAGSSAGALGLTQVVPATGLAIATKLGIADFAANDLYRPKISLQFGASYLASQLAAFGGDPYRALAAYNAGPGAASDAADAAGSDDDLFVEELEFDETRLYVRLVMQNLARYRQLYAGLDRPS